MFKLWGVGDITKEDLINQKFTHLEAPAGNDVNNHITLQRSMRNFYEMQKDTDEAISDIFKTFNKGEKITKESDFEPEVISVNSSNDYIRITTGVAFNGSIVFVNRPLVHNASRQLEKIFNLKTSAIESVREYVDIRFDGEFSATIKKGTTEYNFPTSGAGYSSGIALLKAIRSNTEFYNSLLGIDLSNIQIEPAFAIGSGGYVGISNSGELYYSTTEGSFDLYKINSSGTIIAGQDFRKNYCLKDPSKFDNGIILNSQEPPIDGDVSITIKKYSDGNAIIKWNDTESQFEINKKLKLENGLTGDVTGDLTGNVTGDLTGNVNGLNVSTVTDKTLNLTNGSLTIGDTDKTGTITVTSNNNSPKKITVNENTTLTGGTMVSAGFIKSQQHVVSTPISTTINIPAGFNKDDDTLIVFENLIYFLEPGSDKDYTINTAGDKIEIGSGYPGAAFPAGNFVFLILKNIPME